MGPVGRALICSAVLLAGGMDSASAASFFSGKTITVVVGFSPGGLYDLMARVVARYIGRHIEGNPSVIVQDMPGAGGTTALMYIYAEAPKDGTVLGVVKRSYATDPIFDHTGPNYDPSRLTSIGSTSSEVSVAASWYKSKIHSFEDTYAREMTVGATSATDGTVRYAMLVKKLTPAKLKIIAGYPGGSDITLAMQRGEVDGKFGWSWGSIKSRARDWLDSGKLNILMQMGMTRAPDLPHTPFIMDYAKTDLDRRALQLIFTPTSVAWPILAPPDLPPDRTESLRKAFDETMVDPSFLADAKKLHMDIDPMGGGEMAAIVSRVVAYDAATVNRARELAGSE